jgi:hypothetical protein
MLKLLTLSIFTSGVFALIPYSVSAQQIDWSGLPDSPDPVDIANWMTPTKARYFSQGVRAGCSSQDTLNRYYFGSLAVCNAYKDWYAQASGHQQVINGNLDRTLACQRAGYRYCP